MATCPRCAEPLVSTLAWDKAEFYCLSCGGHFGFLDPVGAPETPELLARMEAVRAEFHALAAGALIPEHQMAWASQTRIADHDAALVRLAARLVLP